MFKKDLLQNKRILITGGGTGLGKEMASHFAEHGADLYICGRRENVLKETADEITKKYGVKVNYQTLDIRASKDVDDYVQSIFDDGVEQSNRALQALWLCLARRQKFELQCGEFFQNISLYKCAHRQMHFLLPHCNAGKR